MKDYAAEIEMAARMGIDGFQMNSDGSYGPSSITARLLRAAAEHGSEFKIALGVDSHVGRRLSDVEIAAYFNAFREHPSALRHVDGRVAVTCFLPELLGPFRWRNILGLIAEDVYFFPIFLDVSQIVQFRNLVGGAAGWQGSDYRSTLPGGSYDRLRLACVRYGVDFAMTVWPQDHRPRIQKYWEAWGSRTAIAEFRYAMRHTGRYTVLVSWNDYSEGHHWQPSMKTQFGYADVARYFISAIKKGAEPSIERDVLYYFHRIERTDSPGTGAVQAVPKFENQVAGSGETHNDIELLAFLVAPGELRIGSARQAVGGGIQRMLAPLQYGVPQFSLSRNGSEVIAFQSAFTIRSHSDYQDLLYRAGSSSRAPVTQL